MRKSVDSKCPCDALIFHSTKGKFFCTLSSEKATAVLLLYNYEQSSCDNPINFTFTGKERDEETGYGYFGARYMDHELMTMWLIVDPMADKYPNTSPYAYCAWNPVKLVNPDGMEINPVYTKDGDFLGNTKEGFTGNPIIMNKTDYDMMMYTEGLTSLASLNVEDVKKYGAITFDNAVKGNALSGDAQEKIVKNIISQYDDSQISDFFNVAFSGSDVAKKMRYDADDKALESRYNFGTNSATIYFKHNNWKYEFTVENIIASVVYHEWLGHDKMGWGNGKENARKTAGEGGTHYACYLSVMVSPIWQKTTPRYKEFNENMFRSLFQ